MADRLTQLQDAVNSVRNFTPLGSFFLFPEVKRGRKRGSVDETRKWGADKNRASAKSGRGGDGVAASWVV